MSVGAKCFWKFRLLLSNGLCSPFCIGLFSLRGSQSEGNI